MLLVGDSEESSGTVAVRRHRAGDLGSSTVEELTAQIAAEVARRRLGADPGD